MKKYVIAGIAGAVVLGFFWCAGAASAAVLISWLMFAYPYD